MTLYFIGIGLSDEKDITVKGLEAVKRCKYIYLENYTSKLSVSVTSLEKFYGKEIILADRQLIENNSDTILNKCIENDVAFLIIGDVFSATTHIDLYLRAKKIGIKIIVINNAGIFNSIGITGLQLYKFGKITSVPFANEDYLPETPYDVIKQNNKIGLHTLVLLDLDPGNNRFLTPNNAFKMLIEIEKKRKEKIIDVNRMAVVCSRMGSQNKIVYGRIKQLLECDFGEPLHSIIFLGKLHFIEEEALELYRI